jgi:hypothetical protein
MVAILQESTAVLDSMEEALQAKVMAAYLMKISAIALISTAEGVTNIAVKVTLYLLEY